jgi:hypothetical protein
MPPYFGVKAEVVVVATDVVVVEVLTEVDDVVGVAVVDLDVVAVVV